MTNSIALEEAMAEVLRAVEHLDDRAARYRAYVEAGIPVHSVSPDHATAADEMARSIVMLERYS